MQCFTIAFWNHLKYLNYLYAALLPVLLFVCVCCAVFWCFCLFIILRLTDTGFTFFLWSTVEKPTHNHLLISAQIPAPPAVWMLPTFDILLPALNAAIQTHAGVSHPPVLSMQMLSFVDAQLANKIHAELKGGRKREEMILACVCVCEGLHTRHAEWEISVSVCAYILWWWQIFPSGMSLHVYWYLKSTVKPGELCFFIIQKKLSAKHIINVQFIAPKLNLTHSDTDS